MDNEIFSNAIENFAALVEQLGTACAELVVAAVYALAEMFSTVTTELLEISKTEVAYKKAGELHPQWVHRAIYSKKKRIRKKYHDKINRAFRRDKDGKTE